MTRAQRTFVIVGIVILVVVVGIVSIKYLTRPKTKRYAFTGIVLSVTPEMNKISARNVDMPGFMESMVMDYHVKDRAALSSLKRGDEIRATLLSDGEGIWVLENLTVTKPAELPSSR